MRFEVALNSRQLVQKLPMNVAAFESGQSSLQKWRDAPDTHRV